MYDPLPCDAKGCLEGFQPRPPPNTLDVWRPSPPVRPAWELQAERFIAGMSMAAYRRAQRKPGGGTYKRHRPYIIPAEAEALVKALGMHDRREAEEAAKAIMLRVRDMHDMGELEI